jgi:methylase of polypeptide subunit release factors
MYYEIKNEEKENYTITSIADIKIKTDKVNNFEKDSVLAIFQKSGVHLWFNYLLNNKKIVENKTVFEPFAGSGPMGLLSAKLGAKKVDFLDINIKSIKYVKDNLNLNKLKGKVIKGDIKDYSTSEKYEVIFANPPFVPIPSDSNSSIHSDGGVDGNQLFKTLLNKLDDLLLPEGKLFCYTLEIEANSKPLIYENLLKISKKHKVTITKIYDTSIDFQFMKDHYKTIFSKKEVMDWETSLKKYGDNLSLNTYLFNISQGKGIIAETYSKSKYPQGFFPEIKKFSDFKEKFLNFVKPKNINYNEVEQ